MTVRVEVAPALLRWAVDRAGWDDETIQRRAPQFDEWTATTRRPTLKQLETFARQTHTPFGLLFLEHPPVEKLPIPDMRTIGTRGVAHPSADLLDTIYLCEQRQEWYREHLLRHGTGGPDFIGSAAPTTAPESIAQHMRALLGFEVHERGRFHSWSDARRHLIERIEDLGVLVMISGIVGANSGRRLDVDEFRGFALADPLAPLIFVNGADSLAAQIFTLVHELAHLWLGESALTDDPPPDGARDPLERWCNRVAAETLVPIADIRAACEGSPETDELERLARRYRVSTRVVLRRIFEAELLSWTDFQARDEHEQERIAALVNARPRQSGGDYYRAQPLRTSRRFTRALIADALEGTTSFRDAYHLLTVGKHATFARLADELGVA